MELHSVTDLSWSDVASAHYDLAVCCSGYEDRCTWVPSNLDRRRLKNTVVLGFRDYEDEPRRQVHDEFFARNLTRVRGGVSSRGVSAIYRELQSRAFAETDHLRVLVDYSSMSRFWYASVLNWFRANHKWRTVDIDFVYVGGTYVDDIPEKLIDDVVCVPGCEGLSPGDRDAVAVFGLGFETLPPFTVVERTEPKHVVAFHADPGTSPTYPARALQANKEFLSERALKSLPLPISSVATSYVKLGEVIAPHRGHASISITPCGPKPHVLASILVGLRFRDVTCLYVAGKPASPNNVIPFDNPIVTRVRLRNSAV